ncbi:MAG TPA: hypothetical protein VFK07_00095 [Candidatus Paceibacterota bacterium]|nr:hypothetical protein [Candidatus Paceibacterota bacterium]
MFTKSDIARGVVLGGVLIFLLSSFSAQAYSTTSAVAEPSSASYQNLDLKNISLPKFDLPSLNSISEIASNSGSFNFWGFFSLKDISNWFQAHGGLKGVTIYVLNIFLAVIQVVSQLVRAVLGYLK